MGVMAKTIADIIASNLQPGEDFEIKVKDTAKQAAKEYVTQINPTLFEDIKRCPNPKCRYENDPKFKYCGICGTEL